MSIAGGTARAIAESTFDKMRNAEEVLRPWVIRHLKPRTVSGTNNPRREQLPGASIADCASPDLDSWIEVSGTALLPFLLATRAAVCEPDKRPVFAEGLASSYEAFLHTRKANQDLIDEDHFPTHEDRRHDGEWYLK